MFVTPNKNINVTPTYFLLSVSSIGLIFSIYGYLYLIIPSKLKKTARGNIRDNLKYSVMFIVCMKQVPVTICYLAICQLILPNNLPFCALSTTKPKRRKTPHLAFSQSLHSFHSIGIH